MSILKLRNEYLLAAEKLHNRVVELTQRHKIACRKEQIDLKRRIICLYTEIRELIKTAKDIDNYCKRHHILEG
ncbi:hypothetical protein FACS1894198_4030 [Clostridia bacterium]|nr:hypothetical protein FACS1894198_4030 [Clostridia bacterium]